MDINKPDKWVVIKIDGKQANYKVFACWNGSYTGSASWQLNSGIKKVTDIGYAYEFTGYSGSIYRCNKTRYGLHSYGASVLDKLTKDSQSFNYAIETLDKDTDFLKLNY
jgi:hypothetical protein